MIERFTSIAENSHRWAVVKEWHQADRATRGPWPGIGDWLPEPTAGQERYVLTHEDGSQLAYTADQMRELKRG